MKHCQHKKSSVDGIGEITYDSEVVFIFKKESYLTIMFFYD